MIPLRRSHLAKYYGAETVLDDVGIEVSAGGKMRPIDAKSYEKTTLIRIITMTNWCPASATGTKLAC